MSGQRVEQVHLVTKVQHHNLGDISLGQPLSGRIWGFRNLGNLIGVLIIRESYYLGGLILGVPYFLLFHRSGPDPCVVPWPLWPLALHAVRDLLSFLTCYRDRHGQMLGQTRGRPRFNHTPSFNRVEVTVTLRGDES